MVIGRGAESMQEIIKWLMHVEKIAARLYRDASTFFNDPAFVEFLRNSANDEAFHYQIMAEALKITQNQPESKSAVMIDQAIKKPIKDAFTRAQNKLNANSLSRSEMIDCIVATEYSEWNDIFLYVVKRLQDLHPQFKSAVAQIQHHLRNIEHFLISDVEGEKRVNEIRKLEPVWTEKILIIEDDPAIAELLTAVLKGEGKIDIAQNGKLGFKKIQQNYYRLIISDINMPEMDGITCLKKASKEYPGIGRRYLFFASNPSPEHIAFLKEIGIKFLLKPTHLQTLKTTLMETLHNNTNN